MWREWSRVEEEGNRYALKWRLGTQRKHTNMCVVVTHKKSGALTHFITEHISYFYRSKL